MPTLVKVILIHGLWVNTHPDSDVGFSRDDEDVIPGQGISRSLSHYCLLYIPKLNGLGYVLRDRAMA